MVNSESKGEDQRFTAAHRTMAVHSTTVCSSCGNQLDPAGDCQVCLLRLGISQPGQRDDRGSDGLPTVEELNAQFPQLEIQRLVGRGGMGAIFQARQTALDRDVALKLIAREFSADAAFVERFEREAKALAKLSHPHIVTVYDFGHTPDGIAYLIMEFVDGINLREAIAGGNVGPDEALQVVSTICDALEYAHSKGVVHRDIKPENILLGEDGTLKVVDFGIAKIFDESVRSPTLTGTRQLLGSLHYMAPEHMDAPDQVDHRVDLYALGVVFYELLTGQLPLGRYEAPSRVHNGVDRRLDAIVLKTLHRRPELRYQRAAELGSDIHEVMTSPQDGALPVTPPLDETPPAAADKSQPCSVPFSCKALGGFAEAVGIVTARSDMLCIEFRIRDAFVGSVKSDRQVVEIPRQQLTRLDFSPGLFRSKLVLSADSISALGSLPGAETGSVTLNTKRKDNEYARQIVRSSGFDGPSSAAPRTVARSAEPVSVSPDGDEKRIFFALLMILCGLLNGAGLAITVTILGRIIMDDIPLIASTIGMAVVVGPLALLQFLTGVANLFTRPRALSLAAAVASMLPLTPVWIVSFPTGAWAYRWLTRDASQNHQTLGPTTRFLLGEARWTETAGWLRAAGGVLVLAAAAIVAFGFYPARMRYRIVDPNQQRGELHRAIAARLEACPGLQQIGYDYALKPTYLTVKTWRRFGHRVEDLLSVQTTPQLVWLSTEPADASPVATSAGRTTSDEPPQRTFPVVSGLTTYALRTVEHRLGTAVCAVDVPFELSSNFVSRVSMVKGDDPASLLIELTHEGREELAAQLQGESAGGLGLVVGGLVEGLAERDSISHKQILFQLSPASGLTANGIAAGIRGPDLPSPLELLD